MSDLKERVGYMTGGNANLIPYKGALVVGDGDQTVYLMTDGHADGEVLTLDSTTPEGIKWAPGGAAASVVLPFANESDVGSLDSAVDTVVAEFVVDFDQFTLGALLNFDVAFVGYGDNPDPVTNPRLKVFAGATASQDTTGGTQIVNHQFGATETPTVHDSSASFAAPAGRALVQVTIRGGTFGEGPEDFSGFARSGVLTISE